MCVASRFSSALPSCRQRAIYHGERIVYWFELAGRYDSDSHPDADEHGNEHSYSNTKLYSNGDSDTHHYTDDDADGHADLLSLDNTDRDINNYSD